MGTSLFQESLQQTVCFGVELDAISLTLFVSHAGHSEIETLLVHWLAEEMTSKSDSCQLVFVSKRGGRSQIKVADFSLSFVMFHEQRSIMTIIA